MKLIKNIDNCSQEVEIPEEDLEFLIFDTIASREKEKPVTYGAFHSCKEVCEYREKKLQELCLKDDGQLEVLLPIIVYERPKEIYQDYKAEGGELN